MQKSTKETLNRMLIETPMAVAYAHTVINAASEAVEERYKEALDLDITAPVRVDSVCKAIIDMFKDPDCPVNKDKFLRGVTAFMLAHQKIQANKKEESNG